MADRKPGLLRDIKINRVALVDNGANFDKMTGDGAHVMLFKGSPSVASVHVDVPLDEKKKDKEKNVKKNMFQRMLEAMKEGDVEKRALAVDAIEKDFPVVEEEDDKKKKEDKPVKKEADVIEKSADVLAIEKRAEALEAQNVTIMKQNETLQKTLATEIAKRETAEMTTLLKQFKSVPVDMTKDVDHFMKMRAADPAMFDRTMEIMKATDEQLAASALYTQVGSGRGPAAGSAFEKLEKKSQELISKGIEGMTPEKAFDIVSQDPANAAIVREYQKEQQ